MGEWKTQTIAQGNGNPTQGSLPDIDEKRGHWYAYVAMIKVSTQWCL